MEKTCCVIGYGEIPNHRLDDVRRELEREIGAALEDGYRTFLTFFEEGAGMLFARLVNERRGEYPDIFLEAVLHPGHCERLDRDQWELVSKSNGIKGLCEECRQDYPWTICSRALPNASRIASLLNNGKNFALQVAKQ